MSVKVSINGVQIKMARAALGITVRELAAMAGVNKMTVSRLESGREGFQSTLDKLQKALEEAGIIFIPENGGGVGVRLQKSMKTDEM